MSARRYSHISGWLKRVEQAGRRALVATLTRLAARSAASTPDWAARSLRVLFLRYDRIGDMVVSTAVMHAIRRAQPGIELDVLASPLNAPVLLHDATIRAVVPFDRHRLRDYWRLWRHLRRARYDIVVDPMVFNQSVTTLLLSVATRAPHRVGVAKPGKPNVYTMIAPPHRDEGDHIVDHLAQLVRPFGGAAADAKRMSVALSPDERAEAMAQWGTGRRVLVNISAGETFRRWPDERFVQIAQLLRVEILNARVMILHSPADRERADEIARVAHVDRAQTLSLRAAVALVADAEFVVSPDTSIVHIASAFDVPTVALFTSDKVTRWASRSTHARAVVGHGATIESVALPDVTNAVRTLLRETRLVPEPADEPVLVGCTGSG